MTIPYIVFRITNLNRSNRLEKPIQSIPSFKWHSILKKSRAQRKEFKTTDESIYYTGWKSELNLKHNEDALTSASKGSNFPFFFFFFNISPSQFIEMIFLEKSGSCSSKYSARSPGQNLRSNSQHVKSSFETK